MMRGIVRERRQGMRVWVTAASAALLVLVHAPTALLAQEAPFTGVVVNEDVPVRSGTGSAFYKVGQLDRGTIVEVEEVSWGWFRIRPPKGVYSYVPQKDVDARGDGSVGEVNTDLAKVKAAHLDGPGQSYKVHAVLNAGTTVRIVGEEGSFYKIIPPDDASVFLPPGSVQPRSSEAAQRVLAAMQGEVEVEEAGEAVEGQPEAQAGTSAGSSSEASAEVSSELPGGGATPPANDAIATDEADEAGEVGDEAPVEADEPAVDTEATTASANPTAEALDADADVDADATSQTAPVDAQPTAEAEQESADAAAATAATTQSGATSADAPVVTPAVSDRLKQVEHKNIPLFMQPLEEQPLEQMISDYQALEQEPGDLPTADQRIVRLRLAVLRRNQELAETLSRINQARQSTEEDKEPPTRLIEDPEVRYDAVGKLLASGVYDGKTLPRMFRLVDPATGRTLAYIEPVEPVVPHEMLGEVVGVVGPKAFNDALKLQTIDVQQINVLRAAAREAAQAQE